MRRSLGVAASVNAKGAVYGRGTVVRSIDAITLCCTANNPSSMLLISTFSISGPAAPEPIELAMTALLTKHGVGADPIYDRQTCHYNFS